MSQIFAHAVTNEPHDVKFLWELLVNRCKEERISSHSAVTFNDHKEFVKNHPYRSWLILENMGKAIGAAYITFNNEISIKLDSSIFTADLFCSSLQFLTSQYEPLPPIPSSRPQNFILNVNPRDQRVIRALENIGHTVVQLSFSLQKEKENERA